MTAESDSSPVSDADLAYAFYNGVPWEKLTDDERAAFIAYQERTDR